jgi:hypothetical protein
LVAEALAELDLPHPSLVHQLHTAVAVAVERESIMALRARLLVAVALAD